MLDQPLNSSPSPTNVKPRSKWWIVSTILLVFVGAAIAVVSVTKIGNLQAVHKTDVSQINNLQTSTTLLQSLQAKINNLPTQINSANLYAVGGVTSGDTILKSAEVYNALSNSWTAIPDMSTLRAGLGVAVMDNKVYALGGISGPVYTVNGPYESLASGEVYDPNTKTWTDMPYMSHNRRNFGIAVLGTKLYVAGGIDFYGHTIPHAEVFDLKTNMWTAIAPMSVAREGFEMAALGGRIYAVGGQYSNLPSAEVYDPFTNSWKNIAGLDNPIASFGMAALGTHVYVVGGTLSADNGRPTSLATVSAYNPNANFWSAIPQMNKVRYGCEAGALGTKLYVVGGNVDDQATYTATAVVYDLSLDDDVWKPIASMTTARIDFAIASSGGQL